MQGVERNVRPACRIRNQAGTTSEYHTSIYAQVFAQALHRLSPRPNRGRVRDGERIWYQRLSRLEGTGVSCLHSLGSLIGGGPENPESRVKLNQANPFLFQGVCFLARVIPMMVSLDFFLSVRVLSSYLCLYIH